MKTVSRFLYFTTVIFLVLFLGAQNIQPAKADGLLDQTITIVTHAPTSAADGESFTVNATASSGLDVSYTAVGECTNVGATFTMTGGGGTCTVQYDQAGDGSYNPAPQVTEDVASQATATPTATATSTDTETPSPTVMPTETETTTLTPMATPTETEIATATVTPSATTTSTATVTASPTVTATPISTALFVSAQGNDQNLCTNSAAPCHTIQQAITKANPGNTIYVTGDIFRGMGTSPIITINKNVLLSGGWNSEFNAKTGLTLLDGQDLRSDILVNTSVTASIENFGVINSRNVGIRNLGTLTIQFSMIYNNNKPDGTGNSIGDGGGIYNSGTLIVNNTSIYGNFANGHGGGGILNTGSLTVRNSTIANNQAHDGGGILYTPTGHVATNPSMILSNVTLSGNSANYGSSIYRAADIAPVYLANPILYNSIMANNNNSCYGNLTSANNNVIYQSSGCVINGGYIATDPLLGVFSAANGYFPLKHGSPAIDAGNPATPGSGTGTCETIDQFATTRPLDGNGNVVAICDIGAYEAAPSVAGASPVANSMDINGGSYQSARVSNTFTNPLSVMVRNQFGAPIAGISITFTAPASGSSGTFANSGTNVTTAITNNSGIATTTAFTANTANGGYMVNASIAGLPNLIQFRLINVGAASSININKGSPQSTSVGKAFQEALAVLVADSAGNPIPGLSVTFTAPASGSSGTFAKTHTATTTVMTNSNGIATTSIFTANNTPGSYTVSAAVVGFPAATFTLTNLPIPSILSPTGNVASTNPIYRWSKVVGATQYRYELWQGTAPSLVPVYSKIVASTVCAGVICTNTPSNVLVPGIYQWRIRAMKGGVWQVFSAYQTFAIVAKAGVWRGGPIKFYVKPTQDFVKQFAVSIYVYGCGAYIITHTVDVGIQLNKYFYFPGSFYAHGTFMGVESATGDVGFNRFYIRGCGAITGGPFTWSAVWKNGSQPAALAQQAFTPILVEPLSGASMEDGSYTVERVGP